ncbi:MAG: MtnX-like HAD-IB family phosphatase [Candidatus Bathyarchaeota archaeon]|nr:MAG: MtnX-like HAD-IB family phosphatase [Candidatus Bathyarchaeota archaeon]
MGLVVLSDFDGTILDIDTCVHILENHAKEDWKIYDEQFERGEISLQDCLQRQFSTVVVPETQILNEVRQVANIRPHFAHLIKLCRRNEFPLIIVSAGLDFVIKHFSKMEVWSDVVQIHAPKAKCTKDGIKLEFPELLKETSINFKDDLVIHHKAQGSKVVYIGDGVADYEAARNANTAFAIKNSKLAKILKKNKVPYLEISEFRKVVEIVTNML